MKYFILVLCLCYCQGASIKDTPPNDPVIINDKKESIPAVTEIITASSTSPDHGIFPQPNVTVFPPSSTVHPTSSTTKAPSPKPTDPTSSTTIKPTDPPITTPKPTAPPKPTTPPSPKPTEPTSSVKPTDEPTHKTTEKPVPVPTTVAPSPASRGFDGPSFIGGIVLASGLMAIGFVAFKFYKARTELNYHTL